MPLFRIAANDQSRKKNDPLFFEMKAHRKNPDDSGDKPLASRTKDMEPLYLRGYCRVCNRHYFYKNKLDTGHLQLRQHHGGICQNCNYTCATIKDKSGR